MVVLLATAAVAVLAWGWWGERGRGAARLERGRGEAWAQPGPSEQSTHPSLPEALIRIDERWQMPNAEALETAAEASQEERQQLLDRLRALLTDDSEPTETDMAGLREVRVTDDPAEALKANFTYLTYERGQTPFSVKSYLGVAFVLVRPPSATIERLARQLAERAETARDSDNLNAQPQELSALETLWRTHLAVAPPSLGQGQPGPRGVLRPHPFGVQLEAWNTPVEGLDGLCGVDMWTDGRVVALRLLLPESVYGSAIRKVWGQTVASPDVRPLNPDAVALELTDQWADDDLKPTTTPAHITRTVVHAILTDRWRPSSSYARGTEFVRRRGAYCVPAPGGKVAEETWRVCEFDALAVRALQSAKAALWHPDLQLKLRSRQTRTEAKIGIQALHADHDEVCSWYAGVAVPEGARETHERVRSALQGGARGWEETATAWDRLLKVDPNGSPEEYALQLAAVEEGLAEHHRSSPDVLRTIKSATEEVMKYSGAHGVSRIVETE